MALVPYTITAIERDVADAAASGKQVVVGAVCSLFLQPSDVVAQLYDNAAGDNGSTSKVTNSSGQVTVWVEPGDYRVSVNSNDSFVSLQTGGETVTASITETQTLAAAQTTVTLLSLSTTNTAFYINGPSVDNGRLVLGVDFTLTSTATIELTTAYADGTLITAVQNDGTEALFTAVKVFDNIAEMKADTSLVADDYVICKRYYSGGDLVDDLNFNVVASATVDGYVDHANANGTFSVLSSSGILTADMAGLQTETLFSDTQVYKSVSYNVQRYTQNTDIQNFMVWFANQDRFHTFDFQDKKLYMSFVVAADFSGKHLIGNGGRECGIIKGAINYVDGTKSTSINGVGFYGEIAYRSLPLPVTLDPLLENDPAWFWYLDDIPFGFGFGAIGALTVSVEANTSDIIIENCYFEMRDAVISGGSAPSDEDRPKVNHVTFRNNETKGIMFHGFASIHFRYSKVYGNHFYEHYCGYACDLSLGSQDSEFYDNTGDRLAAGVKSEPRSFNGSFRNRFYNNRLTLRWRWENTGAAFNIIFRTKGVEVEFFNNTFTCFDYTPIDSSGLNIEGLSTLVKDNTFYIKGTPSGFLWFAQLKNGIDVPTAGQQLTISGNRIFNQTSVTILNFLQITSISSDTFSAVDVNSNTCSGLWRSFVRPEFGTVTSTVDTLRIQKNVFPNTELFRPNSAFTFNSIMIENNIVSCVDGGFVAFLGFITLTDKAIIKNNIVSCSNLGANNVFFVGSTNTTGSILDADVTVTGNTVSPFTGSFLYFFSGGADIPTKNLMVNSNEVVWEGANTFTSFVLGVAGTDLNVISNNVFVNQMDTTTGVITRPIDSAISKFVNNTLVGSITDNAV